jgi:hydroxymethylpyrimidine pyrophosphatase-like HAD family hydrolase
MIEKLNEKYVFFDIDGTLSEYRYKKLIHFDMNLVSWT